MVGSAPLAPRSLWRAGRVPEVRLSAVCLSCCPFTLAVPCLCLPPAAPHLAPAALWTGLAAQWPRGLCPLRPCGDSKPGAHMQFGLRACPELWAGVATQRDLLGPRAAGETSSKRHGPRPCRLGARALTVTRLPREETEVQAQHWEDASCQETAGSAGELAGLALCRVIWSHCYGCLSWSLAWESTLLAQLGWPWLWVAGLRPECCLLL